GRAFATWTQPAYARAELADRTPLRMPPAVRVAELTGAPPAVSRALTGLREAVPALPSDAVLGPVPQDGDTPTVRALVRFDYAVGKAVATALRAAVVTEALSGRRSPKQRGPRTRNT